MIKKKKVRLTTDETGHYGSIGGLTFLFLFLSFSFPIIKIHCLFPDSHMTNSWTEMILRGVSCVCVHVYTYKSKDMLHKKSECFC